jgi:hypothetical protein
MARSNPRILFGIDSVTPYNLSTGLFYGSFQVLKNSTFTMSGDIAELRGGAMRFPWAVEDGNVSSELQINCAEYPNFLFELFMGKAPSEVAAEASGNCSTLTNKYGTSVVVATTGIATAAVKAASKADLKFGKYVVKAVDATTVDVYASSPIDFNRGTDKSYENDLLKITATPLTITTGTAVEIPGFGIELTGGSGTIALVANDTATFEVRPVTTGTNMTATIGGLSDIFPAFGALLYNAKRGSGEMTECDVYSVKSIGCVLGGAEKAFSEWSVTGKAAYYAARSGVFSLRHVAP